MKLTTELNTGYVVLFHDGSKIDVSKQQAEFLMEQSCKKDIKGCQVNNSFITFSSIAKILSIQDYYEQYPDKRPVSQYNQFQEKYGQKYEATTNQVRNPSPPAREQMKKGFIQYHIGQGKTKEESDKKFEDLMKDGLYYKLSKTTRQIN